MARTFSPETRALMAERAGGRGRRADPAYRAELARLSYLRNYRTEALSAARARARRSEIPFELTIDDVPEVPDICPILGLKLVPRQGRGGKPNSPSLDRVVSAKGYIPGNIHWISCRANKIKSDATAEELRKISDYFPVDPLAGEEYW